MGIQELPQISEMGCSELLFRRQPTSTKKFMIFAVLAEITTQRKFTLENIFKEKKRSLLTSRIRIRITTNG